MNPDSPIDPHSALEASLTALLLGELPHEQAAALHQKLAQDAELSRLYERLKHTINLVRETLATPAAQTVGQPTPLKLSDQRREKLLQHFKTVAPIEFVKPRRPAMPWLVPVGIAAAFVVILGGLLLPALSKAKYKAQSATFRTRFLSEPAGSTPSAGVVTETPIKEALLASSIARQKAAVKELSQQVGEAKPSASVPATLRSADTAIVLPKATELADAASTLAGAEGGQSGFTVSGTTRGFYDDSLGRAGGMGGMGGGGGFGGGGRASGGGGGGVRGNELAAEGLQKQPAAGNYFFTQPGKKDTLESGRLVENYDQTHTFGELSPPLAVAENSSPTLEYRAGGIIPTVGPDGAPLPSAPQSQNFVFGLDYGRNPQAARDTGAGSPAWQYPNDKTIGDSISSINAETRRLANVEAPPGAVLPAISATPAPEQEALGKPATIHSSAGPAPVEGAREVAEVPLQAPGTDKAAGDLTARLRGIAPGKPAPDGSDAGERLLRRNQAGLDSANKLADAAATAGQSVEFYAQQNNDQNALFEEHRPAYLRAKANTAPRFAPATTPANSELAQAAEPKQAVAGEGRPSPNSSYFGGGAYGGRLNIQKATSDGDQGVVQARPALRSPAQGGLAGGIGGAASAGSSIVLPGAAVNGTVAPEIERVPSREKLAEAGPSAHGGNAPGETVKLSTEPASEALGLKPPEGNPQARFAEGGQDNRKALGLDWYQGNALANNDRVAAPGVSAPSEAGQAPIEMKKSTPLPSEPAAAATETMPLAIKLPAPAFKGMPSDIPVLGDVPAAGRLFRSTTGTKGDKVEAKAGAFTTGQTKYEIASFGATRALTEERIKSADIADFDSERQKRVYEDQAGRLDSRGANVHSLDVIGNAGVPLTATNAIVGFAVEPSTTERYTHYRLLSQLGTDANGVSRPAQNSIVLPAAQPETSLALKDGKDIQLLAAANQPAATPATLADPAKYKAYFEAKRSLEEAQRSRQIVDMKIASEKIDVELPKTMMVEIVDRAVPPSSASSTLWDKIRGKGDGFNSTARIKIERDAPDISGMMERGGNTPYDPYFVQTESEAIQSEAVLGKVIKDLNLNEVWGKKQGGRTLTTGETMALLKNKLDLRPVRNTGLLEIGVKSDKPEEAANIANAVADEYKARREEQRAQLAKAGTKSLEEQYAQQEEKVREAQKKVDDLRAKLNISDAMASGDASSPLMTGETLRKLESLRIESKAEYDRQQALLDRLKLIDKAQGPEALAQAIPGATADTILSSLFEQLTVAEQKLVALEKEHGPTDPDVLKSKAAAEDLHTKIKSRVDGIMLGLDARVQSLSNSLVNFEGEVAMAKAQDVTQANKTRAYFEAKRTLDELQRSREALRKSGTVSANQIKQADVTPAKPAVPAPIPQPEVQTADNAFSTFSLNVSDVSFKLAAASLEKGVMPEPANVRSEEFINAFDYRDPEPPPGVPVAFAWERAQYPFAQNRDLLRLSIKTAALGRQPGRPLNIVLLLDNSGSMERADRVRIIREALRVLAGQLQPQDTFSVVTFARTAHLWVDGVPGNQAAQVVEQVSGLTPEGGTNLEDAMDLAYQTALRHYLANGVNRVVLLTDGAANLGSVDPEALKQKVEANRKQGVALDCFGIGWEGYNDDLLEVLARNGDGRYAFLNSSEEVASEFAAKLAGALQVAASDVKVQVEFNSSRVTGYRQIGYAKHQLTKEQFRDNTVNAAQIGAAEAGNALYTVEVNPAGAGPLCTVRVRFRIPGTQDYREHAWDVPFTGNAVALEQASPAMRLAAAASAFSEWLASSPYAGEVTPDRLLGYLSGVPEVYGADARPTKLEWMIRQAKSIAGK